MSRGVMADAWTEVVPEGWLLHNLPPLTADTCLTVEQHIRRVMVRGEPVSPAWFAGRTVIATLRLDTAPLATVRGRQVAADRWVYAFTGLPVVPIRQTYGVTVTVDGAPITHEPDRSDCHVCGTVGGRGVVRDSRRRHGQ